MKKMIESIKISISRLKEKKKFISCCIPCILTERQKRKMEGELMPISKGDVPLSHQCITTVDHLCPITLTLKMYKYLFVVMDEVGVVVPTNLCKIQEKTGGRSIEVTKKLRSIK